MKFFMTNPYEVICLYFKKFSIIYQFTQKACKNLYSIPDLAPRKRIS